MTSTYQRHIGSIGARLHALLLPNPELTITAATAPEQVRERISVVHESDRTRLGYHCSATESVFVAERAHAEIDRRLATRRGRRFGVTDKQMRYLATETLLHTAGLVERKTAATSIVIALGMVAFSVWIVLMAFGVVEGLWDPDRMREVDADKLDFLSKTAALSAVVYAVVLAVFGVVVALVWPALRFRRRGAAAIADRVAGIVAMALIAAIAGLAIDAAEHDRTSGNPRTNACDGCGHRARIDDGLVDGWSVDVDENYCPDCAAVRQHTWGYR